MARTIARAAGRAGELALRENDDHLELICNGVFVMDTRDGRSERLLMSAAVANARREVRRVLIGGLGVGFTLAEALATPNVEHVRVIEHEPAVVDWNRRYTAAVTGGDTRAPAVDLHLDDLVGWLRQPPDTPAFDVVCVDVDNGPGWLVEPANAWLYGDDGLAALRGRLGPGGVLSVWCAAPDPAFHDRLERHFAHVDHVDVEVARGAPDRIELARR